MNTALWNTKFKTLFEKLSNEEQTTLINFFSEFISYPEKKAQETIRNIILNPHILRANLGVSLEIITACKSTLVSIYQHEHPDCWLANRNLLPENIILITQDYTMGYFILEKIIENLAKPSYDLERILFLLSTSDEKKIYGGLLSMGFDRVESDFLKHHSNNVYTIINEEYNKIKKYITTPTVKEDANEITPTIFPIKKVSSSITSINLNNDLNTKDSKTLSKSLLFENRDTILNIYEIISKLKEKNIPIFPLIEKEVSIVELLKEAYI